MSHSPSSHPDPVLTGFGHTRFGRLDDSTLEFLLRDASQLALDDAGIGAAGADMVVIGNHGFVAQSFAASLSGLLDEGFRYKRCAMVASKSHRNGCANPYAQLHRVFNMGGMGVSNYVSILERAQ